MKGLFKLATAKWDKAEKRELKSNRVSPRGKKNVIFFLYGLTRAKQNKGNPRVKLQSLLCASTSAGSLR